MQRPQGRSVFGTSWGTGSAREGLCQGTPVTLPISTQAGEARLNCSLTRVSVECPMILPGALKDGRSYELSQDPSSPAFLSSARPPWGSFPSICLVPVRAGTFHHGLPHLSGRVPTIPAPCQSMELAPWCQSARLMYCLSPDPCGTRDLRQGPLCGVAEEKIRTDHFPLLPTSSYFPVLGCFLSEHLPLPPIFLIHSCFLVACLPPPPSSFSISFPTTRPRNCLFVGFFFFFQLWS